MGESKFLSRTLEDDMKRTSAAFAAAAIVMPSALIGQAMPGFDIERAHVLDSTLFVPFVATESRSLRAKRSGVFSSS